MNLRFLLLSGVISIALHICGQSPHVLTIGKRYPNPSLLQVQREDKIEVVSLARYKGLPLIVDFFSSTCVVCFRSLPKLNKIQEQFNGKMRFLLVGKEDAFIRKTFEKFRQKLQLKLDVAYDSILHKDLRDYSYPLYVWIDTAGIVRGITGVDELTASNVKSFVNNNQAPANASTIVADFNHTKPYLINGNGGNDSTFLSRSLFTLWDPSKPLSLPPFINYVSPRESLQLLGARINDLYNYAYFNQSGWGPKSPLYNTVFPYTMLEDGTILFPKNDSILYCYSLWLSPLQRPFTNLQKRFQSDLENQFGFSASVEYRMMPYHRITIREGFETTLLSQSDSSKSTVTHAGFILQKSNMARVVSILASKFQLDLPFIDESDFREPISISVDALMTNFAAVKMKLYEQGIVISDAVKPMRVIVLRSKVNVAAR